MGTPWDRAGTPPDVNMGAIAPIPPKGALMQSTDCVRSRLPKEAHKPDNTEVLVSKIEGAFRSLKRPMNYGFAVSAC